MGSDMSTPVYTVEILLNLEENNITRLELPAFSPDFNQSESFEHVLFSAGEF